jgi:hypothetical protein
MCKIEGCKRRPNYNKEGEKKECIVLSIKRKEW